jgi:hypothetical protein
MQITINKKKITLKYSIRSMMMYENMTQKSFSPNSITDVITFMYCVIVASSKDYSYTFDMFIDYLDEHPDLLNKFAEWIQDTSNVQADLSKN